MNHKRPEQRWNKDRADVQTKRGLPIAWWLATGNRATKLHGQIARLAMVFCFGDLSCLRSQRADIPGTTCASAPEPERGLKLRQVSCGFVEDSNFQVR